MSNPKVLVCNNENLRDRKYRINDGIHLTEIGTSRLANNLKYKIAEALGIQVEKKSGSYHRPEYHNYSHEPYNRNRSPYTNYRDDYNNNNY